MLNLIHCIHEDFKLSLSRFPRSQRGFTLVELSIVLVVIGLLIGGILVAQSLIEAAKINSQIRQLQQLDVATQNFFMNYARWPGDSNSNGIWNHIVAPTQPALPRIYDGETTVIFQELSSMGGFPGNYSSGSTGVLFGNGKKHPSAAIGTGGVIGVMNVRFEPFWQINAPITSTDGSPPYSVTSDHLVFTPAQVLALDTKIDDGNGFSGTIGVSPGVYPSSCVLGQSFCGNTKAANPDDWAATMEQTYGHHSNTCVNESTGAYMLSVKTKSCGLQIKANVYR